MMTEMQLKKWCCDMIWRIIAGCKRVNCAFVLINIRFCKPPPFNIETGGQGQWWRSASKRLMEIVHLCSGKNQQAGWLNRSSLNLGPQVEVQLFVIKNMIPPSMCWFQTLHHPWTLVFTWSFWKTSVFSHLDESLNHPCFSLSVSGLF